MLLWGNIFKKKNEEIETVMDSRGRIKEKYHVKKKERKNPQFFLHLFSDGKCELAGESLVTNPQR